MIDPDLHISRQLYVTVDRYKRQLTAIPLEASRRHTAVTYSSNILPMNGWLSYKVCPSNALTDGTR